MATIHLGLHFDDFVNILIDAGLVKKDEDSKEELKEGEIPKITKAKVMKALEPIEVLDEDTDEEGESKIMTYVDFLDGLVRVAAHYPFGDHEDYQTMEDKLIYIVDKLNTKYNKIYNDFNKSLDEEDKSLNFECKMVVNDADEEEGEYDEEGEEDEGDY